MDAQSTHAGGVVGRKGDSLGFAICDRVGNVRESENGGLSSRKSSEGAEKDSLGEHLGN